MGKENLTGKNAVITGGARGIGCAIAERLLEEGVSVSICARRQESVDAALAKLSAKGRVTGVTADVSNLADVRRLVDETMRAFGGIDILVNNAGIRNYNSVDRLEPADWDRMLAVNLSGPYYTTHEIVPILKQRGGGDIVNVSSLSSLTAFAGGAGYNASKAGLNGLSDATLLDLRYDNIRVTEVMPGSTNTEFNGPGSGAEWKVDPFDIADAVVMALQISRTTTISRIDIKPTQPARKAQ